MKAIRVEAFGEPEVMQVREVPDPVAGPGQVVVRVRAVGVNPVEAYIRSGQYANSPSLPYTPGGDGAGEVESTGEGVAFRPGERVAFGGTLSGAYAGKALCEAAQLHRLPAATSFAQGAALGVPNVTAWVALFSRGRLVASERLLVHGASGGVGVAAVQMARAAGATVVGTAGSPEGLRLVSAQGAHHVVDHHAADHLERASELAGGGFDLIVEMLANVNLGRDLGALAPGGRVVVVGSRGTVELNPRELMQKGGTITGMILWNATAAERAAAWAAILAGLENGTLRPVVARELPLGEAPRAPRGHGREGSGQDRARALSAAAARVRLRTARRSPRLSPASTPPAASAAAAR